MARKSPKRKAKKTAGTQGRKFSMRRLHNALDTTLDRLRKEKKTEKRDELILLVKGMQNDTFCGQLMLIDLGV
jgi:dihydroxyacetone kinase